MPGKAKGINKGVKIKKKKYPNTKTGKASKQVASAKPPRRRITY